MEVRWIDAGKVPHLKSQSIYHGLGYAQTQETRNTIVLATPESAYMCIGHFQDIAKEIDLDYCRENNLPIIRRETGGGGVYIDSGQLFVQWIFQREDLPRKVEQRFQVFLEPIVETYKFFGIEAKIYPPNDVHVHGKKIVGTGAATIGEAEVVTGNFLFDFNIETMTMALNLPNHLFRQQLRIGLTQFLTTFKKEIGRYPAVQEVKEVYKEKCKQLLGYKLIDDDFTESESRTIKEIEQKLTDEKWLFSINSKSSKERLVKIHAGVWLGFMIHETPKGTIEVLIRMKENKIDFIRIITKTLEGSTEEWSSLEDELQGVQVEENNLNDVIESFLSRNHNRNKFSKRDWIEALLKILKEKQRVFGYA